MKLSQYAKKHGIHYNTALKWFRGNKIPGAYQMPSGTILINDDLLKPENKVIIVVVEEGSAADIIKQIKKELK